MPSSVNCGSLTVESDTDMANLDITNCPDPVPSNASADQEITVEPTIENTGSGEARYVIVVLAGDVEVASDNVVTYAGTTTTIPLKFTPADHGLTGGKYDVEVDLRDIVTSSAFQATQASGCDSCGDSTTTQTGSGLFDTVTR